MLVQVYCKCFGYWQSQTGQDCALHTNITNITTNQLDLLLPGPAINYSIYGIHIMDTCGFMYNVYMNYLLLQNPNEV